ncbi:hypothetical protein E2I00_001303 [Balaenoptera physalus]|uniref:Uncharacterized protein n=1 Tax=Balaenoptera physalus TaxID=9770 RepID=A0A6A1QNG6_BALPH|nr:hypothetical protein E2I00_001303 [Balaenoptera physalus]
MTPPIVPHPTLIPPSDHSDADSDTLVSPRPGRIITSCFVLITSLGKPVSLSYRCPCRFFESHVARANVKHLKILNTPNCALQIV